MGTVELKSSLLRILEKIEDEELLRTVYDFLKQSQNPEVGKIWESLSEDQRKEVYQSYKDSEDDDNLTSWNDVKKKY
jgi:predicted HAD superfamily phosphohydrolase